jgi:ABC-type multidrug transport system ATPase subunit
VRFHIRNTASLQVTTPVAERHRAMLEVKNIHQYYGGSHILRDVSLNAAHGQVTVLLGRNGVGKTTLL